MKTFTCLFVGMLSMISLPTVSAAQPSYGAAAYAAQQQEEERWRQLSTRMEELEKTQEVLRKRIATLEEENRALRTEVNRAGSAGVSPEEFRRDFKELSDKLVEVDNKRIADNKLVLEQVKQLIKDLKPGAAPPSDVRPPARTGTATQSDEFYTHIIQDGQTISGVVEAFRAQGVTTSIDAVLRANPKVNPKTLQVGQEILIPKPR